MNKTCLEFSITICGVKIKVFINENYVNTQESIKSVPHDHYDYELHYIKSGTLTEIISGVKTTVKAGELLVIKPCEIHYQSRDVVSDFSDYNFRFLLVKPLENAKISLKNNYQNCIDVLSSISVEKVDENLLGNFLNLEEELASKKFGFIDNVKCYATVILTSVLRLGGNSKIKESGYEFSGYSRNKIDEFFSTKYLTNVKIEDLANDLNLSVRQVNRIMLKYFGVSFKTRLNAMRLLESALRIKTTNESLQKISLDCGFNHYTNFFVSFKKKFGISPADYRLKDK